MKLIAQNIMLRCGDFCILGTKRIVQKHSVDLLWDFVSGRDVGAMSLKGESRKIIRKYKHILDWKKVSFK